MKKLLSLVLVLSMVLGSVAFAFATPADVVGTDCEDAVTRLMALSIITGYEDGSFKPGDTITRAEFAAVVVRSLGLEAAAIKGETSFTDVPSDHWASGYINIASGLGVVKGYGNAMFGPEDDVTYEQAVTMVMRALGYEPKAEDMGGYYKGYLAVAAEEDVTDGVAGVVGQAATRCTVAQLVDNSLEVDLMERTGYGDETTYEVVDKTLLFDKLGATELDTFRVTDVPLSDSDLDSNEIVLYNDDDDEDLSGTYELLAATDANSYFGLEVTAWVNDDDEIFYMTVETDDSDIIYDTVTFANDDYVTLLVEDDDFDFVKDVDTYVNFESTDLEKGAFGRFVMDGDEVVFASVFDFDTEDAVVTDVDSDQIDYVDVNNDDTLELDNYDDAYYFTADMMEAELGDVEDYNAVAYFENDDDEVIVMFADTMVEGELESVKAKDVKVDGKWYDLAQDADGSYESVSFYSKDELADLEDVDAIVLSPEDAFDTLDDFADENVSMILDFNGDAIAVVANVDGLGDTVYGLATWAEKSNTSEITVFNGAGEEVTYDFETRSDLKAQLLDTPMNYYNDKNDGLMIGAVKFKLNSDGEVADGEFTTYTAVAYNNVYDVDAYQVTKDEDSKRVTIGADTEGSTYYYIDSDTVLINAIDDGKADLDPELVDYDDVYESAVNDTTDNVYAIVLGDKKGSADMMIFVENFAGSDDDVYYAIAVDGYTERSGDNYAELDVYDGDKDEYLLGDTTVAEGDVFSFTMNSDDEVVESNVGTYEDELAILDGDLYEDDYVTYDGDVIRVADDVVIYTADDRDQDDVDNDKFNIDASNVSASKLDYYDYVRYVLDEDGEMVVALLWNLADDVDNNDSGDSAMELAYTTGSSLTVDVPTTGTYIVVIGDKVATVVNDVADFTGKLSDDTLYTAELFKLSDLNTVLDTLNFVSDL